MTDLTSPPAAATVTGPPRPAFGLRHLLLLACLWLPVLAQAGLVNRLADHPSPYLAMHGADPVHWQDWGPEVLELARAQNKILFVSSGYFACHWCHVMQQESYRDPAVAALLNTHFIPVKVDRELQPALDAHLIDFVERTRGSAGWPLNVFLTPVGHPLLGLTYASRNDFHRLLVRLGGAWESQREQLQEMARAASRELVAGRSREPAEGPLDADRLSEELKRQALSIADELQGGFGQQSRFPMAPQLMALLALQAHEPDARLAAFLTSTLDQMAGQGMHDLLAGGFFRYTVDPGWQIPHFEKMLYNQAQNTLLFLRAAALLNRPELRQVARLTLDFVIREMAAPAGGFIASLSAVDEKGVEGGAYLWTEEQLAGVLDAREMRLAGLLWGMTGAPNNEGGYLPVKRTAAAQAAVEMGIPPGEAEDLTERMRAKLRLSRATRAVPRDDKTLAAWNGLMLSALCAGVSAFGDDYRPAAGSLRDFIVQRLWDGDKLSRSVGPRGAMGTPGLEDYAFVAAGLADWAKVSGSAADRKLAERLVLIAWERFYDQGWRSSDQVPVPGIPAEPALPDSPLPSASAALIRLTGELGLRPAQLRQARRLAYSVAREMPFGYAGSVVVLLTDGGPNQR
jgi:uncharacterized protein YyaL (SSP411 family)